MDRPEWISRAKPVEAPTVDIGFLISDTFYYGPENDFSQEQWQRLREPLYKPNAERYGKYLLSAALEDSAAELVRYYQDVVRLIGHHGRTMEQELHYFWMRPLIFVREQVAITFPWYDTWEEAVPFLDALTRPDDGLLFEDLEQGWEVNAFAECGQLFLRQGDFDIGEEYIVVATDRAQLSGQVPAVRQRIVRLLQEMSAALGHDYWSGR